MSEVIVIKPDRPARHECALPAASAELDAAVALCPSCGRWSVCDSVFDGWASFDYYWRAIRPWDRRPKALIRTYRKNQP